MADTGIDIRKDPRLRSFYKAVERCSEQLTLSEFARCLHDCELLVYRALTGQLVIPDFQHFAMLAEEIFDKVESFSDHDSRSRVTVNVPEAPAERIVREYTTYSIVRSPCPPPRRSTPP